jgi:hypothetical protein
MQYCSHTHTQMQYCSHTHTQMQYCSHTHLFNVCHECYTFQFNEQSSGITLQTFQEHKYNWLVRCHQFTTNNAHGKCTYVFKIFVMANDGSMNQNMYHWWQIVKSCVGLQTVYAV